MGDDSQGTPAASPTQTPWMLAQRLADQGLPLSAVREQLLQAGLPSEDVTTLLRALRLKSVAAPGDERAPDAASAHAPSDHGAGLLAGMAKAGVGAGLALAKGDLDAGKLVLTGLLQATASFMQVGLDDGRVAPSQPKLAPSELAPLELAPFDATDGSPRCQVHPRFPSVGTCPRCGALACYNCAPKQGFGGTEFCAACEQQPSVHEARVKKAARHLAATVFVEAVLLLTLMFVAPLLGTSQPSWGGSIPYEVALSLPFVVLGIVQGFVRHPWPGVVGAVVSGGLVPATLFVSPEEVPMGILMLLLAPMVAMLFALDRLTTRRKGRRVPGDR
ncbi:hypothetical protein [Hyalangium sp.]|uniref:hypothetical protein n=1 Tax=Hyalangium sp. TaxID=2028555 RepID=UPI002D220C13|nr:hypothetical protein [Hyalangium sp.]HYI01205.1 hypothetical protein [Hyalangium sp.]